MAEETDLSRSEPASPRRLQAARRAGDVPRSAEFARWLMLLAGVGAMSWLAARLLTGLEALAASAFAHAAEPLSFNVLQAAIDLGWLLLPLLAAIFVAALAAPLLMSGWTFSPQTTQMDLTRISPLKPFSRLLSQDALFDALALALKLLLVAGAVAWAWTSGRTDLPTGDSRMLLHELAAWVGRGVLALAVALALAAALDAGWRWWRYLRRHAMTWQEVLAEAREAEVHPEIRGQLRARQQQAGQSSSQAEAGTVQQTGAEANTGPRTAGVGAEAGAKTIGEAIG